ncbi:MAG: FG-GAP-like repeat-containing protein, partial [Actinomycetota bacterium]|nr:FG-GAP-like repeat-containing protein [Actinomycetota bacterium]
MNDYWIGVPSQDVLTATNAPSAVSNAGRVYAINGRTRSVLYRLASPEIQESANFGFFITNLGDVNGDGRADLIVGTDAQDTTAAGAPCRPPAAGCNENQGKAWVFSGRTAALLYAINNPNPQPDARFGSRTGRAGDLNGDGVAESIVGASNNDVPAGCGEATPVPTGCRKNQGQAFIFDGRTGNLFRTLNLPASDQSSATCSTACGGFGLSVQGPGDVNGDGITDQLVNASSLSYTENGTVCTPPGGGCLAGVGAMYLFSGANGAVLARIDDPAPEAGATFGFQDAAPLSPGDVNGDGRADLYANGFSQDGRAGESQGRMWVFDGRATVENPARHGVVLYEPKDPTPTFGGQCCFALDRTDYNKDGRPDLYVGASPHHAGGVQSGGTYVFDGRNGTLLRAFELPPGIGQAGAGSFANLGSNLGWSVAAPGDLNGDGEPDYVAGAPFHDVGDDKDAGASFVFLSKVPSAPGPPPRRNGGIAPFSGCPSLTANVIRGSAAGGRITGTPLGDRIFGGTGNDVVDGLAGDDCIDLGPGTDRSQGGLGNDLMLGGLGEDRMSGSSGNDVVRGGS